MNRAQRRATKVMEVSLTNSAMKECASGVIAAMNEAQKIKRFTIDEVLMATAYALGCAMAQRGAVLNVHHSVDVAIPPLADGYNAATEDMRLKELVK